MKVVMRWMMLFVGWVCSPLSAQDVLVLDPAALAASGIRHQALVAMQGQLEIRLPARVAVPNDRLRVVSAQVPGIVTSLEVGDGEPVRVGQPLARMHSVELAAMESEHLVAMAQFALADSAMARDRDLFGQGIIARRRFDDTQAQWREARVALDHSRTRLTLAGLDAPQIATLERTRRSTGMLTVAAPIDGVVLTQSVSTGEQVALATPLYTIGNLDVLWLEIHTPQSVAAQVRLGDRVQIPESPVAGEIIAIGRRIHEADQGVLLRARVVPGRALLLPGQFAEAVLTIASSASPLYAVPIGALAYLDAQPHVFVWTGSGYRAVAVSIISERGDRPVVQGALSANAEVAVSGVSALKAMIKGMGSGE